VTGVTAAATKWKCPCPDCPPSDFEPMDVTSPGDHTDVAVCQPCGKEHPAVFIVQVRA
jgi:hypothetical protein